MNSEDDPWWVKEQFWKDFEPGENRIKKASKEVEKILTLLNVDEGSKILDLCCGVARHSVELAKKGHHVTGVDITSYYLEKAKKRAKKADVDLNLIQEDMRDYSKTSYFDVVLNLWTSFGYFEKEEENQQVLNNVYNSLKNGGKFLIDLMGKEVTARIFKEKDWLQTEDGFILVQRSIENGWEKSVDRRVKISSEGISEYEMRVNLYSGKELRQKLDEAGFSEIKLYGTWEGDPYDEEAERLIAIARK